MVTSVSTILYVDKHFLNGVYSASFYEAEKANFE